MTNLREKDSWGKCVILPFKCDKCGRCSIEIVRPDLQTLPCTHCPRGVLRKDPG